MGGSRVKRAALFVSIQPAAQALETAKRDESSQRFIGSGISEMWKMMALGHNQAGAFDSSGAKI